MKISVKDLSFKTLFMVGLLVITLDNQIIKAQDSSENSLEDPSKTYCLGNTYESCVTAGACCTWCSSSDIKDLETAKTSQGICYFDDAINQAGACPASTVPLLNQTCTNPAYRVSATCTCSPPLFSNDASAFTAPTTFFTTFFLAILAFFITSSFSSKK